MDNPLGKSSYAAKILHVFTQRHGDPARSPCLRGDFVSADWRQLRPRLTAAPRAAVDVIGPTGRRRRIDNSGDDSTADNGLHSGAALSLGGLRRESLENRRFRETFRHRQLIAASPDEARGLRAAARGSPGRVQRQQQSAAGAHVDRNRGGDVDTHVDSSGDRDSNRDVDAPANGHAHPSADHRGSGESLRIGRAGFRSPDHQPRPGLPRRTSAIASAATTPTASAARSSTSAPIRGSKKPIPRRRSRACRSTPCPMASR